MKGRVSWVVIGLAMGGAFASCNDEQRTKIKLGRNPGIDAGASGGEGGLSDGGKGGTEPEGGHGGGGGSDGGAGSGGEGNASGNAGESSSGAGGEPTDAGSDAPTDSGVDDCADPTGYSWSAPLPVEALTTFADGFECSLGMDAEGRAFALIIGRTGPAMNARVASYDPDSGWTTATPLLSAAMSNTSFYPRVVMNRAGNVLTAYRLSNAGAVTLIAREYTAQGAGTTRTFAVTGDFNDFFGGAALDDAGHALLSYTHYDVDHNKGYASIDYGAGSPLLDDPAGGYGNSASLAADGTGAVFGTAGGVFTAVPYSPSGGFAAPEPTHDGTYSPINGYGGVSLGGGALLAAFGSRVTTATRVQLFATLRSASGTWSMPRRFDTGDDSGNAQLSELTSRAPNTAFALWTQPNGFYLGRFGTSSTVGDVITIPVIVNWSLAADRCGNAAISYLVPPDTNVHVRYYAQGVGWLADTTVETGTITTSNRTAIALGHNGQAMVLLERSGRFYYSKFEP